MVAVLVLAAGITVLVVLWRWIDTLALVDIEKKAATQLDAVKISASIVVAGGGLFALYLAARRQRTQEQELEARHAELKHREAELGQRDRVQMHAEKVAEDNRLHAERTADANERDAADRRVTELYAKSVEQLGSDKAPVRLGGLYALERLAQHNDYQRQTVASVICAYLRMPYTPPEELLPLNTDEANQDKYARSAQEREVRLTAQRILGNNLRRRTSDDPAHPTAWSDIDIDLTGATLIDFNLAKCDIRSAVFNGARFFGLTRFTSVVFKKNASFRGALFYSLAFFDKATFHSTANFDSAEFEGVARFTAVQFSYVCSFNDAVFQRNVIFSSIKCKGFIRFKDSTFNGHARFASAEIAASAVFTGATFKKKANFEQVFFGGASDFTNTTFEFAPELGIGAFATLRASFDSTWPAGWSTANQIGLIKDKEEKAWYLLADSFPPQEANLPGHP
ncbi:pentapeptide repeat-containing protein [Lentzea chajnantorensis]